MASHDLLPTQLYRLNQTRSPLAQRLKRWAFGLSNAAQPKSLKACNTTWKR